MNSNYLTAGERNFEKFHIIEHVTPNAGFCYIVSSTLNGIRHSLENNWLPVVDYGIEAAPHFYDPAHGENVWEYYFEPVFGTSPDQVRALLEQGEISQEMVHRYSSREADPILLNYIYEPDFISTFWFVLNPEDPGAWMAEKRQLGREYTANYLFVKPHILAKVEEFHKNNFADQFTFGVHIRGTDLGYAEPTGPESYFDVIYQMAADDNLDNFKIFLATDQTQYVELFEQEFGKRVITYDSIRSSSDVPAFLFRDVSPYKKGEDVLIDVLLLSRCSYLLKCAAAVGEYAMWFNPALECTDFGLESDYSPDATITAYHKLNIGQLSSGRLKLLTLYKKTRVAILDALMVVGRTIVPFPIRDRLWKMIGRQIYYPESDAE